MVAVTLVDLVQVAVTTLGSGPIGLGEASPEYRGTAALVDGATYHYSIRQPGAYEYGEGVYDASAQTLARTVIKSSNGDNPVLLLAGAVVEFVALAEDFHGGVTPILGPNLSAIAAQDTDADKLSFWTGPGTAALTALTAFGRTLIGKADQAAARVALGLGTMATAAANAYAALAGADFTGTTSFSTSGVKRGAFDDNGLSLGTSYQFGGRGGNDPLISMQQFITDGATPSPSGGLNYTFKGRWSPNQKPITDYFYKSRGVNAGDIDGLRVGDGIYYAQFDGDTGDLALPGNNSGHVASIRILVDRLPPGGVYQHHEMYGRIDFFPNPGDAIALNLPQPNNPALSLSCDRRVYFWGETTSWQTPGYVFPAIVCIGAGNSAPTQGQLYLAPGTLLTTPEPNVVETDAAGSIFTTPTDGIRRQVQTLKPIVWGAAPVVAGTTITMRTGLDWAEMTIAVTGADISVASFRFNFATALAGIPAVVGSYVTSSTGVAPAAFQFSGTTARVTAVLSPGNPMVSGVTYTLTVIVRQP